MFVLLLAATHAAEVHVPPGADLGACFGLGVSRCVLGAGSHRGTLHGALSSSGAAPTITAEPGALLLGTTPVPAAGWELADASSRSPIWRTTLAAGFPLPPAPGGGAGDAPTIEQLYVDDAAPLVEAHWPNLAWQPPAAAAPADVPGGPLDPQTWGRTANAPT